MLPARRSPPRVSVTFYLRQPLPSGNDLGEAMRDPPARIYWDAPDAGEYWIAVEGQDTGTYGIVVWGKVQPER